MGVGGLLMVIHSIEIHGPYVKKVKDDHRS